MQFWMSVHRASAVGFLLVACAAGCSVDREQQLIGKWQGDELSATFAAIKLKEDSGASTEDAKNAAKVLVQTYVEIKSDKSFTAGMGGATTEGTWTFNKETGEVILNISKVTGPDGKESEIGIDSWCAYLDSGNRRLALYPMPAAFAAELKKTKEKGALKQGISLYKR